MPGTLKYTSSVLSLLEQISIAEKWVPPRNVNDFIMFLAKLFRSLNASTATYTATTTNATTKAPTSAADKASKVGETDLNTPNSFSQKEASQVPLPLPVERLLVRILFIRVDKLDSIESGLSWKMSQLAKVCLHLYDYIHLYKLYILYYVFA